ncbi:MAG: hypothetical protein GJU76_15530 [Gallionella sp.]|jgi:hypothetical protein|nr:hypothetical protein [Gallionella sp.]
MTTQIKVPSQHSTHAALPVSVVHCSPHGPLLVSILHAPFDWITAALVLATIGLAYFTWRLWRATGTLVKDTESSAQNQMRAYVGVDGIGIISTHLYTATYQTPPNTKPGTRMRDKVDVQMKNFGGTPANRVDFAASIWTNVILPDDSQLDEILEKERKVEILGAFVPRHSIFPGQSAPMHIYLSDLTPFRAVLADTPARVFVFGRIDYSDMFDKRHTTRFCYFFDKTRDPGKEFVAYERYNEAT